jgi:hypothetical protein
VTPMYMVRSSRSRDDEGPPSTPRVATVPPRPAGRSGVRLVGVRDANVPPPLPRAARSVPPPLPRASARLSGAQFSSARRSQPPPRKRRAEFPREAVARRSAPAISNDVWRDSLHPAETAPVSTRLEPREAGWRASFERWLRDALHWLAERAPWQRCAIGATLGTMIGLGAASSFTQLFHFGRAESGVAVPAPHAVDLTGARASAPVLAPEPAAALAEQTVAGQSAAELDIAEHVLQTPARETKRAARAVKHVRRHSHSHHASPRPPRS